MTKRMLIDATHAEETRVVVLDGNRLEDFDVETSTKRQLKGNIYLAKVVRVEPSLQAAFVEYGGNRHGFLAFGEIHPDYYQIPIADRQRLIEMQAEDARREEEAEDRAAEAEAEGTGLADVVVRSEAIEPPDDDLPTPADAAPEFDEASAGMPDAGTEEPEQHPAPPVAIGHETIEATIEPGEPADASSADIPPIDATSVDAAAFSEAHTGQPAANGTPPTPAEPAMAESAVAETESEDEATAADIAHDADGGEDSDALVEPIPEQPPPETVGGEGDNGEDARERRIPPRFLRNYKIQEVIRRRQILLVQVVKEERGTKGAALTTYLSLAGRFCVLMPNSPRGGGISRKITSATDRRRLKEIMAELEIPHGMGLIVRTAGANRPKPEIRRDCEYLLRLWDDIRDHTLKSVAPALIYEEASLIKRAIRDVYSRDIDEIQVDGEQGWRAAHEFMRMLMPSHAKKVQLWRDSTTSSGGGQPLFAKYQVEAQLDGMLQPIVQLRSGGYLVINQAEALVAIDVNSGRSTRERGIEETALRTNLEAADEVARQLRLRDLAGLIVIDFIDMESKKNNAMVERRLKEALKNDRARIQVGHISHFGLMEMSRQRLRPSLAETSFIACPHCGGTGHVRSTESAAIHVLRGIEEEGAKRRAAEIVVYTSVPVALYILNHKRDRLGEIEARYAMRVVCLGDDDQLASQFRIDRVKPQIAGELPSVITPDVYAPALPAPMVEAEEEDIPAEEDEDEPEDTGDAVQAVAGETQEEAERRHRRRRRRRRGARREEGAAATTAEPGEPAAPEVVEAEPVAVEVHVEGAPEQVEAAAEDETRVRRRGRRGGRRRRPDDADGAMPPHATPGADQPELPPVYTGPTPANPFGGHTFDIFDVLERAEEIAAIPAESVVPAPADLPADVPEPVAAAEPEPLPEPVAAAEPEPLPGPVAAAEPEPLPGPVEEAAPQHVSEPEQAMMAEPHLAMAEPLPMAVDAHADVDVAVAEAPREPEPEPEPAIKPIVIGNGETLVVEKKRGWWRR